MSERWLSLSRLLSFVLLLSLFVDDQQRTNILFYTKLISFTIVAVVYYLSASKKGEDSIRFVKLINGIPALSPCRIENGSVFSNL